jgi:hypothetical protein
VIYGVLGRVLQQGAKEGEVRDYPAKGKGRVWVELTVGREMAARRHEDGAGGGGPVARHRHEDEERKGGGALAWLTKEKNGRARKRGRGGDDHPFKRARGGVGWSAGGATRRQGVGRGVGASTAVGRRGVPGSGARGWRADGQHATDAETGEARDCQVGPRHSNGRWDLNSKKEIKFDLIQTILNQFKL